MTKLREMRLKRGFKVKEVARLLNRTEVAIYYYEIGKRGLNCELLKKFAEIYNCKVDDLI